MIDFRYIVLPFYSETLYRIFMAFALHRLLRRKRVCIRKNINYLVVSSSVARKYGKLSDHHVQLFERVLDYPKNASSILRDANEVESYNVDWLGQSKGSSKLVLRPKTSEEMSHLVRICYEHELPICFQGGNTGLVSGSVPIADEILISTSRMNEIESFDQVSGILTCQAGCVLEWLDSQIAEFGYMMPLDLGAKGSCVIGGNMATGAGGVRLLRFGSLHAHTLGMEVVTANGRLVSMMNTLRKDNTSFHLPHIFIGSEGQFGVITKVSMTCVARPASVNVALLGCKSFDHCCRLLTLAKSKLSEILSSFEFLDRAAVECVEEQLKLRQPLDSSHDFYILVETMGSDSGHDAEKLSKFLEISMEEGIVENGTMANSVSEAQAIWKIRESVTEALKHDGYVHKCDISLPLKYFYQMVVECRQRSGPLARRIVGYGHLGDGNLHLNITEKRRSEQLSDKLFPFIYDWTVEHAGSISAEHGIGRAKLPYWTYGKSEQVIETMRGLKKLFDPKLLFNPGKTIAL